MLPIVLMGAGSIAFFGGAVWFFQQGRTEAAALAKSAAKVTERPIAAPIGLAAFRPGLDYHIGSSVGGIKWKKGYSYVRLYVKNDTDETYSDVSVILQPEYPIIEARCESQLANCKIGLLGQPEPTQQIYLNPDGSVKSSYQEEPHPDNIYIGPPYRLFCDKIPPHSQVRVDLAVGKVRDAPMGGSMWEEMRHDPAFLDVVSSYTAYGRGFDDKSRLTFEENRHGK